jgi:hypothetical protein
MSEVLRDREFESNELNKLAALLRNRAENGIDQIRYTNFEAGICLVPYRKIDEKGHGSFYLTDQEFEIIKKIAGNIELVNVGSITEELTKITLEARSRLEIV